MCLTWDSRWFIYHNIPFNISRLGWFEFILIIIFSLVYRCVPLFTFTTQQTQPLSQLDEAEAEYTESLLSGSLHLYLFISQLLFHVKVFALVIIVFMARNFLLTQDDGGSVEAKYVFVLLLFFLSSRKIPVFHQGHGHPDRAENKNQFINISGWLSSPGKHVNCASLICKILKERAFFFLLICLSNDHPHRSYFTQLLETSTNFSSN